MTLTLQPIANLFQFTFAPLIHEGKLTKETASRYFNSIFQSEYLVDTMKRGLDADNLDVTFTGMEYTEGEVEVMEYMQDEFVIIQQHSIYDDFSIFVKEELEPRDSSWYVSFIIKPHINIYSMI